MLGAVPRPDICQPSTCRVLSPCLIGSALRLAAMPTPPRFPLCRPRWQVHAQHPTTRHVRVKHRAQCHPHRQFMCYNPVSPHLVCPAGPRMPQTIQRHYTWTAGPQACMLLSLLQDSVFPAYAEVLLPTDSACDPSCLSSPMWFRSWACPSLC